MTEDITVKKGIGYLVSKYGIAMVANVPVSTALASIMVPICTATRKTQAGKIGMGIVAVVGSALTSTGVSLAVSDKIMEHMCPKIHNDMKELLKS